MKARTARIHYIVMFMLAFVSVFTVSVIFAIGAVTPFAYTALRDKLAEANEKRRSAVEAAKAKKAALQKEQAKLKKDKKKLEKKKKKALEARAKRIYEERVSEGYTASLSVMDEEISKGLNETGTKSKSKSKPAKKSAREKTVSIPDPVAPAKMDFSNPTTVEPLPESESQAYDYTENGSMFRGLNF